MKNIITILKGILRGFFLNSFWKSPAILLSLGLSLAINGFLWYIFESKLRQNSILFIFTSVLIALNFSLGNFLWNREKLASLFLALTCLFIQILMIIFVSFLFLVF